MAKGSTGKYEKLEAGDNDELNVTFTSSIRFTEEDELLKAKDSLNEESKPCISIFAVIISAVIAVLLIIAVLCMYFHRCSSVESNVCFYWTTKDGTNMSLETYKDIKARGFNCITIGLPFSESSSIMLNHLQAVSNLESNSKGIFKGVFLHGYPLDRMSKQETASGYSESQNSDCISQKQEFIFEVSGKNDSISKIIEIISRCKFSDHKIIYRLNTSFLLNETEMELQLNCILQNSCDQVKHWIVERNQDARAQRLINSILALVNKGNILASLDVGECISLLHDPQSTRGNYSKCLDNFKLTEDFHSKISSVIQQCDAGSISPKSKGGILYIYCHAGQKKISTFAACVHNQSCPYEDFVKNAEDVFNLGIVHFSGDLSKTNSTEKFGFVVFKAS